MPFIYMDPLSFVTDIWFDFKGLLYTCCSAIESAKNFKSRFEVQLSVFKLMVPVSFWNHS